VVIDPLGVFSICSSASPKFAPSDILSTIELNFPLARSSVADRPIFAATTEIR